MTIAITKFYPTSFRTPFWLSNPHLQSILPKFLAKKPPQYRRELIKDSVNESDVAYDFYDVMEKRGDDGKFHTPLLVLFHGLEGGSDSHYASTLAHQVHEHAGEQGWHFVVPHYRSCGGVPVQGELYYNAGDTSEAHHVLSHLSRDYAHIFAVGVSLGGNVLAKYMGEYGDKAICQAAVVVSAPLDLASSSMAMQNLAGRYIYSPYLLNPLVSKALESNISKEELASIKASKSISDFDHGFTAPRHGYRSVNHYYNQASALPHLLGVTKPTLIITAKDDPFLGMGAREEDVSSSVTLIDTKHGGHIGFMQYVSLAKGKGKFDLTWLPNTAIAFCEATMD